MLLQGQHPNYLSEMLVEPIACIPKLDKRTTPGLDSFTGHGETVLQEPFKECQISQEGQPQENRWSI